MASSYFLVSDAKSTDVVVWDVLGLDLTLDRGTSTSSSSSSMIRLRLMVDVVGVDLILGGRSVLASWSAMIGEISDVLIRVISVEVLVGCFDQSMPLEVLMAYVDRVGG
jgi:hypothetical protein